MQYELPKGSLVFNNWQLFSDQNYFDPSGLFIGVIFCVPIFFIALISVILALKQAAQLVIQVKRLERKHQLSKKKSKQTTNDNSNDENTNTNANVNTNSKTNKRKTKSKTKTKTKSKASKKKD